MAGRNFSLTPRLSLFVDRQVGSGRHHCQRGLRTAARALICHCN